MKLTKETLKRIIKEELDATLNENEEIDMIGEMFSKDIEGISQGLSLADSYGVPVEELPLDKLPKKGKMMIDYLEGLLSEDDFISLGEVFADTDYFNNSLQGNYKNYILKRLEEFREDEEDRDMFDTFVSRLLTALHSLKQYKK